MRQACADGGAGGAMRGELRLRVLCSLPQTHQRYLFEEIRKLCRAYLSRERVLAPEMTPEELISEIWLKLLGAASLHGDEAHECQDVNPSEWTIDPSTPDGDGRVVWLIEEIGGLEGLKHRREDILRQRFGRFRPGVGRPTVQLDDENGPPEIGTDPDEWTSLHGTDGARIWRGLLATAALQFSQDDDVSMLLRLMAENPGILEDSSNAQWPVKTMIAMLNVRFPPPSWSGDRVDNAKRRLMNWINRLMRNNGLN
jgi:hypothetical protein